MASKQTFLPIPSKRLGATVGCAAVALMGFLSVAWSDSGVHSVGVVAGSGAGSGGVYVPPSTANMNVGATATWTAPASTPAVAKAKPRSASPGDSAQQRPRAYVALEFRRGGG
jgi:hypothetical protein